MENANLIQIIGGKLMKVVITGGGGFLGTRLCNALVQIGRLTGPSGLPEPIDEIVLFDSAFPSTALSPMVRCRLGDIADRDAMFEIVGTEPEVSVFHLASMVSGECELRFDDAIRVNLDGGRIVLEAVRRAGDASKKTPRGLPRIVFASSIACFGGDVIPDSFSDDSKQLLVRRMA
jgi:D-erythronate 2-dehydrogenase